MASVFTGILTAVKVAALWAWKAFAWAYMQLNRFFVHGIWDHIKDHIWGVIHFVKDTLVDVGEFVWKGIKPIWDAVEWTVRNLYDVLKDFVKPIVDTIYDYLKEVWDAVSKVVDQIHDFFRWVDDNIIEPLQKVRDAITTIKDVIVQVVSWFDKELARRIDQAVDWVLQHTIGWVIQKWDAFKLWVDERISAFLEPLRKLYQQIENWKIVIDDKVLSLERIRVRWFVSPDQLNKEPVLVNYENFVPYVWEINEKKALELPKLRPPASAFEKFNETYIEPVLTAIRETETEEGMYYAYCVAGVKGAIGYAVTEAVYNVWEGLKKLYLKYFGEVPERESVD